MHTGSENHGCEAIVRGTKEMNNRIDFILYSENIDADKSYKIDSLMEIREQGKRLIPYTIPYFYYKLKRRIFGVSSYCEHLFNRLLGEMENGNIYISIGGDMYCYRGLPEILAYLNLKINQNGNLSVLWGCSIEPNLLKNKKVIDDLKKYSLIIARESITYDALIKAGIVEKCKLYPDPAFLLNAVFLKLPENFQNNDLIGINLSPLITRYGKDKYKIINNFRKMISYIIQTTSFHIMLIPHVFNKFSNDYNILEKIYMEFVSTNRVVLISDCNAMELKGFIARCRMFIGARTHATIAAYSSCVPTIVVGYSVKAHGIAKDIFGTHEKYVVPVQTLINGDEMIAAFDWLVENEVRVREKLETVMPHYIFKARMAGEELKKLID